MTPGETGARGAQPADGSTIPGPIAVRAPSYRWYHKISAVLFITFCLEIGFFLLIFPWTDYWDSNYFSAMIPEWHRWWDNTTSAEPSAGWGRSISTSRLRRCCGCAGSRAPAISGLFTRRYSQRSALIGSMPVARRAGM